MSERSDKLAESIQEFINAGEEIPRIVRGAVLVYETMRYDDDGDEVYSTNFSCIPGTTLATAIGVLDLGKALMINQVIEDD